MMIEQTWCVGTESAGILGRSGRGLHLISYHSEYGARPTIYPTTVQIHLVLRVTSLNKHAVKVCSEGGDGIHVTWHNLQSTSIMV